MATRGSLVRGVGNAPCSWGVLEFDLDGGDAGYERVLDEMSRAGFAATELGDWGFMPNEPQALKAVAERFALPIVGAFVPVAFARADAHAPGIEAAVRTPRLLADAGQDAFIVLADDNGAVETRTKLAGRIGPEHGLSPAEWNVYAQGVEAVARAVRDATGLRCVFHFHCAGYVETPTEIAELMQRTDPTLVGLCFDTGHYAFGGGDPLKGLRAHIDRVWHVHFKDCDPAIVARARTQKLDYFEAVKEGVFCELGKGAIDFMAVAALLEEHAYRGWIVVEQDVLPGMGSPFESACRNRAYLQEIGL